MDEYIAWDFNVPGISFNIVSGRITIFKTTLKAIGYPEFFHFLFSPEDRIFGIEPCRIEDGGAYRLPERIKYDHNDLKNFGCKDHLEGAVNVQDGFEKFLKEKKYTAGAIRTRLSRANKAENLIPVDLDTAVADDEEMYKALLKIRGHDTNGNLQNAVRLYYEYRNGRQFPRLREYEKLTGRS